MAEPAWRPMREGDLDAVAAVAALAFPDHFEDRACFAERLSLYPQGCFVLAADAQAQGYLIAYPWPAGSIPPLGSLLGELPPSPDAFYLHDLALAPSMRGRGHARPIVDRLTADIRRRGARTVALVAVNRSVPFWRGMGFAPVTDDAAIARKLATYGPGAAYMQRAV